MFHSTFQPGHNRRDLADRRPGDPLLDRKTGRAAVHDKGLGVGPVIEPDPGLAVVHVNDTALITARPAARLIHQHHARGCPGPEIVIGQLQPGQGDGLVVNQTAERPGPGLKSGGGQVRLRLDQVLPFKILNRGVNLCKKNC